MVGLFFFFACVTIVGTRQGGTSVRRKGRGSTTNAACTQLLQFSHQVQPPSHEQFQQFALFRLGAQALHLSFVHHSGRGLWHDHRTFYGQASMPVLISKPTN